ncbi:hypothetical protein C4577_07480 [Candidatus Parcubacteria bacterium]|nr:MAG: hypothetical protein C4577_07480 [Candidatus Parcubacteria bacterium]
MAKQFNKSNFGKIQKRPPLPSKKFPNTIDEEEETDLTAEELLLEALFGEEEEEEVEDDSFWRGETALYPASSHIFWFKFFPETEEVLVQFKKSSGLPYLYSSSRGEVDAFRKAVSKGKYFWAVYRSRGFRRVASSYSTKWQ